MKKIVSIFIVAIMLIGVFTTVNATKSSELANKLYEMGKDYGFTQANKVRIERYLAENPVSDADADKILAKAQEMKKVFDNAKATKFSELSKSQKEEVKSIASETASIIGLTVKFKTKEVEIYKNGKLIEVARYDSNKLLYTGNNTNIILVVSSIAGIALVAFSVAVARKKLANA